ncbi:hypothetical protein MAR_036217 [Mya arenaria]|uniref:Uncharacterized protein n=1 Tax=Mya arenaria TaxID=6604 RepID=A0ABY7EVB4_MYAAR|nr:hypothetical protein MAR_036217 [Mya arenaria]
MEDAITTRFSTGALILAAVKSTFPSQISEKRNDGYAKRKRTFKSRVVCLQIPKRDSKGSTGFAINYTRHVKRRLKLPDFPEMPIDASDGHIIYAALQIELRVMTLKKSSFTRQVRVFESRLNISGSQYFRLRYPDAVEMDKLPSDVFSSDDAAFAKETAQEVIAFVEDYIE